MRELKEAQALGRERERVLLGDTGKLSTRVTALKGELVREPVAV
jgi:hypothetical protein